MTKKKSRSTIEAVTSKLRAMALDANEGDLLGGEDELVAKLGGARGTVRQAARLLRREGLLRVRRGVNGGYFSARPDASTIVTAVSAYLDTVDMDIDDVTSIASVLWVEVMRKAASLRNRAARAFAESFRERVMELRPTASYREISRLEQENGDAIFSLVNDRYIELICHINMAFARRRFPALPENDDKAQREFVRNWRHAKLMELAAIADGDTELAVITGYHMRNLWHCHIWGKPGGKRGRK